MTDRARVSLTRDYLGGVHASIGDITVSIPGNLVDGYANPEARVLKLLVEETYSVQTEPAGPVLAELVELRDLWFTNQGRQGLDGERWEAAHTAALTAIIERHSPTRVPDSVGVSHD